VDQVEFADTLVVTKTDLMTSSADVTTLKDVLRALNPKARIIFSSSKGSANESKDANSSRSRSRATGSSAMKSAKGDGNLASGAGMPSFEKLVRCCSYCTTTDVAEAYI